MLEEVLKAIGVVVLAGGGLVGIAYAIFKRLGERWLDAKFEERLAAYRHEQQKELEQLRFKINALLDRSTKLHQREFEVLPEAWSRLNDAYWKAIAFVSPLQQYPDLNRMTAEQLEEFLSNCSLNQWEKSELRGDGDRNAYYIKRLFWHRLADMRGVARESHIYLLKSGIFLPAEVRAKFGAIGTLIWEALDERAVNEEHDFVPRESVKQKALRDNGPQLIENLEQEVHGRLWNSEQAAL